MKIIIIKSERKRNKDRRKKKKGRDRKGGAEVRRKNGRKDRRKHIGFQSSRNKKKLCGRQTRILHHTFMLRMDEIKSKQNKIKTNLIIPKAGMNMGHQKLSFIDGGNAK